MILCSWLLFYVALHTVIAISTIETLKETLLLSVLRARKTANYREIVGRAITLERRHLRKEAKKGSLNSSIDV